MKKEEEEKSNLPFRGWLPKTPERKWYSNQTLLISITILLGSAVVMMWIYPYLSVTPAPPQSPTLPASPTISQEGNMTITEEEFVDPRPEEPNPMTNTGRKTIRFQGHLEGEFFTNSWAEPDYVFLRGNYVHRLRHVPLPPTLSLVGDVWGDYSGTWDGDDFQAEIFEIGYRIRFWWWCGINGAGYKLIGTGTYVPEDFYYHVTLNDAVLLEIYNWEQGVSDYLQWGPQEIKFSFTLRSSDVEGLLEDMK